MLKYYYTTFLFGGCKPTNHYLKLTKYKISLLFELMNIQLLNWKETWIVLVIKHALQNRILDSICETLTMKAELLFLNPNQFSQVSKMSPLKKFSLHYSFWRNLSILRNTYFWPILGGNRLGLRKNHTLITACAL